MIYVVVFMWSLRYDIRDVPQSWMDYGNTGVMMGKMMTSVT